MMTEILTLILLKPKVICIWHQFTARPTCRSVQSDLDSILVADHIQVPINDNKML